MERNRPARPGLAAAAFVALGAGCTYPATAVTVMIGTDIPDDVPLEITAVVFRGTSAPGEPAMRSRWLRRAPDGGADSGIVLPATFAVVPAADGPRDQVVTIVVEGRAGGVLLRRTARFAFVPRAVLTLPIFLTSRCAERASGCTTTAAACTHQLRCEEQQQTCGNGGECVELPTGLVGGDGGADFGDVPRTDPCGLYGQSCCAVGGPCRGELSCVGGQCRRCTDPAEVCCTGGELRPDGAECAAASGACQRPGTCAAGACGPVTNVDDGTRCAPAVGPCQRDGVCAAGVCGAPTAAPDGTACAMPVDPQCQRAGTCAAGVCAPVADLPDGTMCGAAPDACHTASRCRTGRCVAGTVLPDGAPWGGGGDRRCCRGAPLVLNTTANCGACGLTCAAGERCAQLRGQPQWYCTCAANAQCYSSCCSTFYGAPFACAASNCAGGCIPNCPGGTACRTTTGNPNYCGY